MRFQIAAAALAALMVSSPAMAQSSSASKAKSAKTSKFVVKAPSTTKFTTAKVTTAKVTTTRLTTARPAARPAASAAKTFPTPMNPTIAAAISSASAPVPNGTLLGGCDAGLLGAAACQGYYSGNVLNGSPTDVAIQQSAIEALPGDFMFNGDWNALAGSTITALSNGNWLDFGVALFGETIVGVHFGNVAGDQFGNVTGFYYFNFLQPTQNIVLSDAQGFSTATLFTTSTNTAPVPEPSTWAMLLLGFGVVGYGARRRRRYGQMIPRPA